MRAHSLVFGSFLSLLGTACSGLSLGENKPGGDTYLEYGAIAVDDRSETSFVLSTETAAAAGKTQSPPPARKALHAIDPDSGTVRSVADLTGREDPRLLFPSTGVLVMSEAAGVDELRLLDATSFETLRTVDAGARYHGTRMSPSRDFIAVADNTAEHAPIHVLDAETLTPRVIPHDGEWLEAMWQNESDRLFAIVFYDMDMANASARILSWPMADVALANYSVAANGCWTGAELDLALPGKTADLGFSFTWVGVSPNDRWVVFPVRDQATSAYELVVLDTSDGTTRTVPNAMGPVGFTPDGSTIVSYREADRSGEQSLLLIDAETLAVDVESVPIDGALSYFVSHEGNFVVVASNWGGQRLVLYDVDNDAQTQMDGPGIGLDEFVSRIGHREIWLVDDQALHRIDLDDGEFDTVTTSFAPEHINILPARDRLVLDDADSKQLFFFDPEALEIDKAVVLPSP